MSSMPNMNVDGHMAAAAGWTKSAYSDHGNACVEWQFVGVEVLIRDSKYRGDEAARPIIAVPARAWSSFLAIAAGDTPNDGTTSGIPTIEHDATSGETVLNDAAVTLTFTAAEWEAFVESIRTDHWKPVAA